MARSSMSEHRQPPHLVGLAKIEDEATLRQVLAGWWPGMDDMQPSQPLAGVDAYGEAFRVDPDHLGLDFLLSLTYPLHVVHAIVLPERQVKPASEAKVYQR